MSYNIFVSYSSDDKSKIEPILDQLSTIKETDIFFADWTINPGDEISQKILYNIQNSDVFIVFYSKFAINSNYVQQEIGAAKSNDKLVIPILLDSSKPTGMLKGLNYLNFYDQAKKHVEIKKLHEFITEKIKNQNKLKYTLIILGMLAFGYFLIKTICDKSSEKIDGGCDDIEPATSKTTHLNQ